MKEQSRRQSSGGRKDSSSISFSFFISATVQNWGNISLTQLANGPHTATRHTRLFHFFSTFFLARFSTYSETLLSSEHGFSFSASLGSRLVLI